MNNSLQYVACRTSFEKSIMKRTKRSTKKRVVKVNIPPSNSTSITQPHLAPPLFQPQLTQPQLTPPLFQPQLTQPQPLPIPLQPQLTQPQLTPPLFQPQLTQPQLTPPLFQPQLTQPQLTPPLFQPQLTQPQPLPIPLLFQPQPQPILFVFQPQPFTPSFQPQSNQLIHPQPQSRPKSTQSHPPISQPPPIYRSRPQSTQSYPPPPQSQAQPRLRSKSKQSHPPPLQAQPQARSSSSHISGEENTSKNPILLKGDGFDQHKLLISTIASILRSSLEEGKPSWKKLSKDKRNDLFDLFKKRFTWPPTLNDMVRRNFEKRSAAKMSLQSEGFVGSSSHPNSSPQLNDETDEDSEDVGSDHIE
uniref:Extensin-like n=1 Tax=Cicer arietinum TaxID=3827 RepID=A0A1S3DY98_CICAR|nr:extensin-like [Cicer arietinum]